MSRKAPKGICFHTLKSKDAHSPLEPERGVLLLGRSPREMGWGAESPSKYPHLPSPLCSQSSVS